MLRYHYTREGESLLIAQMDDGHLRNTIKLYLRRARDVRQAVDQGPDKAVSELDRVIYDLPEYSAHDAGMVIREALDKLYPYLAEAFLRGTFDDLRPDLIAVVGREHALANPNRPQLPPPGFVDDMTDVVMEG